MDESKHKWSLENKNKSELLQENDGILKTSENIILSAETNNYQYCVTFRKLLQLENLLLDLEMNEKSRAQKERKFE